MYRQFNIQQFYVLPTQCIYVFCVDLRTNSSTISLSSTGPLTVVISSLPSVRLSVCTAPVQLRSAQLSSVVLSVLTASYSYLLLLVL